MAGVQEMLAERYELLDVLGRGGMGVVYRARDRVLDRVVAVKVLPLDRAQEPTSVARFEREALAVARLSHRNIVAVFDAGTDGETRFIVMEFIAGRSLAQLLRESGPLDVEATSRIGAEVAGALAVAHAAGIVHRDIKPANVMLDAHGRVKVLDFGIARLAADISLTQTAMVLGSAAYLAPELISGARADAASDIYALGCVLYELLAGRPPFTGDLAAAILHQHNSSAPPPLTTLDPRVPPALDALIMGMLAKQASRRPQDAGEVARALASSTPAATGTAAVPPLPSRATATDGPAIPPAHDAGARDPRARDPRARDAGARDAGARDAGARDARAADAPTLVMPRGRRSRPILGRALAVVALLVVVGAIVAVLATAGGPTPAPASHKDQTGTRTDTRTDTRASNRTDTRTVATTSSTVNHTTPSQTVGEALSDLSSLINQDLQAGTVAQPAANAILGDAQRLLAADQAGQPGPALAGLVKLGADVTGAAAQGKISSSALPALNGAVANVEHALERAVGNAITTPVSPAPRPNGHPPPGHVGKGHGHGRGHESHGGGQQGNGDS